MAKNLQFVNSVMSVFGLFKFCSFLFLFRTFLFSVFRVSVKNYFFPSNLSSVFETWWTLILLQLFHYETTTLPPM